MRIVATRVEYSRITQMYDIVVVAEPTHPHPYLAIETKNKDAEEPAAQLLQHA
jgi:hypothetical protein